MWIYVLVSEGPVAALLAPLAFQSLDEAELYLKTLGDVGGCAIGIVFIGAPGARSMNAAEADSIRRALNTWKSFSTREVAD